MITADQLFAHAVGDYVLQSHWMATRKTSSWWAATVHGVCYSVPFLLLGPSFWAWALIAGSHVLIDRLRLARYVVLLKEILLSPTDSPVALKSATGYPEDTPPWLAVWLYVIADNVLHVAINAAALRWL